MIAARATSPPWIVAATRAQRLGRQRAAARGQLRRLAHVVDPGQRRLLRELEEPDHLRGQRLPVRHLRGVHGGLERPRELLAERGLGRGREALQDGRILEREQFHAASVRTSPATEVRLRLLWWVVSASELTRESLEIVWRDGELRLLGPTERELSVGQLVELAADPPANAGSSAQAAFAIVGARPARRLRGARPPAAPARRQQLVRVLGRDARRLAAGRAGRDRRGRAGRERRDRRAAAAPGRPDRARPPRRRPPRAADPLAGDGRVPDRPRRRPARSARRPELRLARAAPLALGRQRPRRAEGVAVAARPPPRRAPRQRRARARAVAARLRRPDAQPARVAPLAGQRGLRVRARRRPVRRPRPRSSTSSRRCSPRAGSRSTTTSRARSTSTPTTRRSSSST